MIVSVIVDILQPGKYVLAVSGGVDSVVLMDVLTKRPELDLIIAHFDHGIRPDSNKDRIFVRKLAKQNGLNFEQKQAKLGSSTSEAAARQARYEFLSQVKDKYAAKAIVTAHHQDDVLETAILNLMRGTGRRGISSLQSTPNIIRPLLKVPKKELINYAKANALTWQEDSTNKDVNYLRNYVRNNVLSRFSSKDRNLLLGLINQTAAFNRQLDKLLSAQILNHTHQQQLNRDWFIMLPHMVSREVMATWLRQQNLAGFDKKTIERLVVEAKTGQNNSRVNIYGNRTLEIKSKFLALGTLDR